MSASSWEAASSSTQRFGGSVQLGDVLTVLTHERAEVGTFRRYAGRLGHAKPPPPSDSSRPPQLAKHQRRRPDGWQ
ncbi:hypothetical protein ACFWAY_18355 [Rhodococcus sp. NPDC059968]|uniref:hypothetical protein n=1 Tax=Rhodococcus sp. NPDC059968 TaxID=3347017 RepID=UPI00366C03AC